MMHTNWLDFTEDERQKTIQSLEDEMEETYPERILSLTGRKIVQATLTCPRCSGLGGNGWEDVCSNCAGDGSTLEWVFESCGHRVEANECDEDCSEVVHFPEQHPPLKALWEVESERSAGVEHE